MSSAARNYKIPLELEKEIRDEQSESRATESSQTNNNTRDEIQEIKKIIKQESQIVRTWRWVVIIAMTLVAGAVTVATYFFLSREEHDDFENAVSYLRAYIEGILCFRINHLIVLFCLSFITCAV